MYTEISFCPYTRINVCTVVGKKVWKDQNVTNFQIMGEFFGFYTFWIKEFSEWVYISSIIKRKNYVKKPNNNTNLKRHKHVQWLPMYLCMHSLARISQGPETVNSVMHGSLVLSSSALPTFSFQIKLSKILWSSCNFIA